jgi:hypothetical protein
MRERAAKEEEGRIIASSYSEGGWIYFYFYNSNSRSTSFKKDHKLLNYGALLSSPNFLNESMQAAFVILFFAEKRAEKYALITILNSG